MAVSFPGAEFVKGEHGHCSNLTDAEGRLIATNGAEMAEVVRGWLVEDWLGGDSRKGKHRVRLSDSACVCESCISDRAWRWPRAADWEKRP